MPTLTIHLSISKDELLKFYRGSAKSVMAKAQNGQVVRFPVEVLRQFVTQDGVVGRFCIQYTKDGQFQTIEKL